MYEFKGQSSSKRPAQSNPAVKHMHSFILESYQIPVNVRWFLPQKVGYFNQFLVGELITDVYSKFTAQLYVIDDEYGKQASSYEMIYYSQGHINNFKEHIKDKLIRVGFGLGYGLSFDDWEFATIKSSLSLRYYSNLINPNLDYVIKGGAILVNFGVSIGLKVNG